MREDRKLYERAVARAWTEIQDRLGEIARRTPGRKLELVSVQYDPVSSASLIEELPDTTKSSRPQAVQVSVRLTATYALH